VRAHLLAGAGGDREETPKAGDPCFANVQVDVIGDNALAVHGAAAEAARHGFDVEIESAPVSGEARQAGVAFARRLLDARARARPARPVCMVGGGETTVTVVGAGIGGRNLEFAAAAALAIDGDARVTIGSVGTDGRDGPRPPRPRARAARTSPLTSPRTTRSARSTQRTPSFAPAPRGRTSWMCSSASSLRADGGDGR
jgi:glycerate-2-kinase